MLFYITLCFSLFFPLMGAWLCHANIVQRVKSCYKIKINSRESKSCFMGFYSIKATLDNLQKHKVPSKCHFYSLKAALLQRNSRGIGW